MLKGTVYLVINPEGYQQFDRLPLQMQTEWLALSQLTIQPHKTYEVIIADHQYRLTWFFKALEPHPLQKQLNPQTFTGNRFNFYFIDYFLGNTYQTLQIGREFKRVFYYRGGMLHYSVARPICQSVATQSATTKKPKITHLQHLTITQSLFVKARFNASLHN